VQEAARKGGQRAKPSAALKKFEETLRQYLHRLAEVKILDPACGSGNFLYVAINLLLDLEKQVIAFASTYNISLLPHVRPTQLLGIEINPFAQELAQVVIWIGGLQWMQQNGFIAPSDPVLEPFENIQNMDAILDLSDPANPKEPEWPAAEFESLLRRMRAPNRNHFGLVFDDPMLMISSTATAPNTDDDFLRFIYLL